MIIYQMLPRLWGDGTLGSIDEASFEHFRSLGITHVWYTGLLEHATCTDYTAFGILRDHRAMVKGKAGSPYAIKDYYDIDPDLADDVNARMLEFENLVRRTHAAKLKVIIDFVPNHVARNYHSDVRPAPQIGGDDDTTKAFSPMNNFYYFPR